VRADEAGIKKWILDPGFGFAKTVEQNYQLLNDLDVIADKVSGTPRILVGVSRKSIIYKPLDLQPDDVLSATQAVHMVSLMKGADILRVHDVKEARQTVRLYQFL
jgi:dihydropteroate synthase